MILAEGFTVFLVPHVFFVFLGGNTFQYFPEKSRSSPEKRRRDRSMKERPLRAKNPIPAPASRAEAGCMFAQRRRPRRAMSSR